MSFRSSFVAAALLAAAVHSVAAQAADPSRPIAPGTRVRVTAPLALDAKHVTGTLISIDETHALVQQDGFGPEQPLDIPIEKLDRIEVSHGRVSGSHGMVRGMAIGAGTGAAIGGGIFGTYELLANTKTGPSARTPRHDWRGVARWAGQLGSVGFVAGAVAGYAGYERWKLVHVPGQVLAVHPVADGDHLGLALALPRRAASAAR